MQKTKVCSSCEKEKDIESFGRKADRPHLFRPMCRMCERKYGAKKNRERRAQAMPTYAKPVFEVSDFLYDWAKRHARLPHKTSIRQLTLGPIYRKHTCEGNDENERLTYTASNVVEKVCYRLFGHPTGVQYGL